MPDDQDLDDHDYHTTLHLYRRHVPTERMRKFEAYVAKIFTAFGLDLHTPATERTPERFIRARSTVPQATRAIPSC